MTCNEQKYKINKETLVYFCNKHRNKNILCNAKIIYNRKEEEFYLTKNNNKKCLNNDKLYLYF